MMPAGVLHTQAQIEAELEQHLQDSYGITVERSTKLDSFTVDEATGNIHCVLAPTSAQPDPAGIVTVNSSSAAAAHSEVVASYLIGCDGARSTVRKGLGVPFPGFSDPGNRFLLMDCTYEHEPGINSNKPGEEAEGLPPPDRIMASTTAVGLVGVIPLVDVPNAVRLVWNAGGLVAPAYRAWCNWHVGLHAQQALQAAYRQPVCMQDW
jgi:2-polyprenyl-6-methoxyphenol hydroxylase-like FAD-dependent oxidoreductase